MYCRQVQSHLDDYILNQIDKKLFEQVDNHLRDCKDCQKLLETNRQLILSLQTIKTPDPGDYYWQQMEASILAKTIGNNKTEISASPRIKVEPINVIQRYLIPLAASFALLLGTLLLSDPIQSGLQSAHGSHPYFLADNGGEITARSDSQIFTAIVSAAPGSLGKQLLFANIGGGSR